MSISKAVLFHADFRLTQEHIRSLGNIYSFVTSSDSNVTLTVRSGSNTTVCEVEVPRAYKVALHALSYKYELLKFTVAYLTPPNDAMRPVYRQLLSSLFYLNEVRTAFYTEASQIPRDRTFQTWRSNAFDYYLWLDYMCGDHGESARHRLEVIHNITFEVLASRAPGIEDILTIFNWSTYRQRYCQVVDFCGLEYPLEKMIGRAPPDARKWVDAIVVGVSRGAQDGMGEKHAGEGARNKEISSDMGKEGDRDIGHGDGASDDENAPRRDKGKGIMQEQTSAGQQQQQEQALRPTTEGASGSRPPRSPQAMEALNTLMRQLMSSGGVPSENPSGLSEERRTEAVGLRLFTTALAKINEEPTLIREFFQLAGMAEQARSEVQLSQSRERASDQSTAPGAPVARSLPSTSDEQQQRAPEAGPSGRPSRPPPPTSPKMKRRGSNPQIAPSPAFLTLRAEVTMSDPLFTAWKKYRKP
ncbi:hypothetical protein HYDPIDRAFT_33857 [Hydnomerulius pinastri MD-312]|uniref:Uncharacterized protein n=1 Tax=Hydnomerulius pinastri MD-312 TaxID=994086 RepID=A0A0C9VM88_9AGAM|nr:hypothetical protein HYDPIDRAFT_33857 [Hydnomerulius pinastri MD-312]